MPRQGPLLNLSDHLPSSLDGASVLIDADDGVPDLFDLRELVRSRGAGRIVERGAEAVGEAFDLTLVRADAVTALDGLFPLVAAEGCAIIEIAVGDAYFEGPTVRDIVVRLERDGFYVRILAGETTRRPDRIVVMVVRAEPI
jgi:hypothetical protein